MATENIEIEVNSSDNSSAGELQEQSPGVLLRVLDPSVSFLLWASTNLGCVAILYLFYKTSALREVSGYLMVTITCIDMCIAQFIILPTVYATAVVDVPWKNTLLCPAQAATNMFLHNLKAAMIMLCAIDRMCSIAFPFHYMRHASTRLFWIEMASICCLCATMPILLFGALRWSAVGDPNSGICWPVADESAMVFYYVFMLINEIIPGAVVIVCYSIIMSVVCKQRQNIFHQENAVAATSALANSNTTHNNNGNNNNNNNNNNSNSNNDNVNSPTNVSNQNSRSAGMALLSHLGACKMLFLVTVLYFLSFLPIVLADHFLQDNVILYHICTYLAYLNITTNFPIYYRMNKTFKVAYKTHIGKLFNCGCLNKNDACTGPVTDRERKYELDC